MAVLDNEQNQKLPYFVFENYKLNYDQNSELAVLLVFGRTFRTFAVLFYSGRTLGFGRAFVWAHQKGLSVALK